MRIRRILEDSKKQERLYKCKPRWRTKKKEEGKKKRTIHNVQLTGKKQETPVRDSDERLWESERGLTQPVYLYFLFLSRAVFLVITKGAKTMTQQETSLWGISHEWSFLLFHSLDWGGILDKVGVCTVENLTAGSRLEHNSHWCNPIEASDRLWWYPCCPSLVGQKLEKPGSSCLNCGSMRVAQSDGRRRRCWQVATLLFGKGQTMPCSVNALAARRKRQFCVDDDDYIIHGADRETRPSRHRVLNKQGAQLGGNGGNVFCLRRLSRRAILDWGDGHEKKSRNVSNLCSPSVEGKHGGSSVSARFWRLYLDVEIKISGGGNAAIRAACQRKPTEPFYANLPSWNFVSFWIDGNCFNFSERWPRRFYDQLGE